MRKLLAWLGGAALIVLSSSAVFAAGPSILKPYIVMILDSSTSMGNPTGSGPPSCSDANGNLLADTKLNHARCAINDIVNSYGDIVFAFGRFHEINVNGGTVNPGSCGTASSCDLHQDGCNTNSSRFQLLTALVDGGNAATATWSDFQCNTCSQNAPFAAGTNPEVWSAFGATPIQGSLEGSKCYWLGQNAKQGHCSVTTSQACECTTTNTFCTQGCPGTETCVFDGSCVTGSGVNIWPSAQPGFSPITNDSTNGQFLPSGSGCIAWPSCYSTPMSSATESGSVATFTTTTPHGLQMTTPAPQVTVMGMSVSGYNGTWTVTSVGSSTTFTATLTSSGLAAATGGAEILADTSNCCTSQCRPYIVVVLSDGDETCGGTEGHCSTTTTTTCVTNTDCTSPETCVFGAGHCSVTTGKACYANQDCPIPETCVGLGSVEAAASSLLHTVVSTGSPATFKNYRVETKPIGFGTATVPYGPVENLALAGGATSIPGQNAAHYANDQAGIQLAISQIIESSVRVETCNNLDDDCDGAVDEDFPLKGQACNNGKLGVCYGTGVYVCTADGSGVTCNITSAVQSPQTSCPSGKTCNSDGTEICGDSLDNDCDGFVDEGCTACVPQPEICNGKDDDCDGVIDEDIPVKQCAAFPGAVCSPNAACCGTQTCVAGAYTACSATVSNPPPAETCNNIDDDCDGAVDENLTKACSNITGNGCTTAPCPATNNPGDPGVYTCSGMGDGVAGHLPAHSCTGPGDTSCAALLAGSTCTLPIAQNACHPGTETCTAGAYGACNGEQKPTAEICDGIDNDCDNIIDEDTGGGSCNATCGTGTILCAGAPGVPCGGTGQPACGTLYCSATSVTVDASCDGVDEDCDGLIDEDWKCSDSTGRSTPAVSCGCTAPGECNATNKCINGQVVCSGTPVDPSSCCDCNGTPQNGMCSGGASCTASCQCAYPCSGGEFPCPLGKKCSAGFCVNDPCYGINCPPVGGNAQTCVQQGNNGVCVDACTTVTCPNSYICYGPTGTCKPNDCTTFPSMCTAQQVCVVDPNSGLGSCVSNPCAGVTCPTDQYCEQGMCYESCASVNCPSGQRCVLGKCQADPCGHMCPFGKVCNDQTGQCVDDPCQFIQCPQGQYCNPADGQCEPDPCVGTSCPPDPPGQVCRGGTCYGANQFSPDAGYHVTVGGGGCSTGGAGGTGGMLVGLVLGVLLLRRRRDGGAS